MSVPGWPGLRAATAARIGLARAGSALATGPLLELRLAHARARDAVHAELDEAALLASLEASGMGDAVVVCSRASDRASYLRRPDLGRALDDAAAGILRTVEGTYDLVVVVGDGLSALAVQRHAGPLLAALRPAWVAAGLRLAPVVVVWGARVKVGDEVAAEVGAQAVLMLIGERPGLSAPDSLGAYLTWAPGAGTTDADRNCVSNIRPDGLSYGEAAFRIDFLYGAMRRSGVSGVALKDESGAGGLLASGG